MEAVMPIFCSVLFRALNRRLKLGEQRPLIFQNIIQSIANAGEFRLWTGRSIDFHLASRAARKKNLAPSRRVVFAPLPLGG